MKAFVLARYGGPDSTQIRDVPVPAPAAGEVLVRVHAAGLNPIDFKTREGKLRIVRSYQLPLALGSELAGVVEAVGAGITRFSQGDRVFARVDKARLGAFAEFATVPEAQLARVPDSLSLVHAAAVPLAALTALQGLRDELHVAPGERIFIPGGAGGVGTFAIQIAKLLGAHVATTASPSGADLVRRLGADVVIDYTRESLAGALSNYDAAFDLVGGKTLFDAFGIMKQGAKVVSIAATPEPNTARIDLRAGAALQALFWLASFRIRAAARRRGLSYRFLFMRASGPELDEIAVWLAAKKLEVVVDRVFPFQEIAGAFAYLEQGHAKGKVVVQMVKD